MEHSLGTHLILDAWDAPFETLDDPAAIRAALLDAVGAAGATLIEVCVHRFSPYGVTATATLAESHIALHTWPEHGYFAADLFFCGSCNYMAAMDRLREGLNAGESQTRLFRRGIPGRSAHSTHSALPTPHGHEA